MWGLEVERDFKNIILGFDDWLHVETESYRDNMRSVLSKISWHPDRDIHQVVR